MTKSFFLPRALEIAVILAVGTSSCQKSGTDDAPEGGDYEHPNSPSGMTSAKPAAKRTISKAVSLVGDTEISLGTTTLTIPLGALNQAAIVSLTSYGGVFLNSSAITLKSEPVLIQILDSVGNDIAREDLRNDLSLVVETAGAASGSKLALLFHENGGLATAEKTGLKQSALKSYLVATTGGKHKATLKVRPSRFAVVLADTGGGLPTGFSDFTAPPTDVSDLSATVVSPSEVDLSWASDDDVNDGSVAIVSAAGTSDLSDCTLEDVVSPEANATSGQYAYRISDLSDGVTYKFKICATSKRSPADLAPGKLVSVTTPIRASAVLAGTLGATSNAASLNVTVSGSNLTHYKYAVLSDVTSCATATYSAWIAISTPITDSITGIGNRLLCVLGKISESNVQLVPTTSAWTIDTTPPLFSSINLTNSAADGYINNDEKTGSSAIVGGLSASGHDGQNYAVVANATSCDGAISYTAAIPSSNYFQSASEGVYKVCVQLYDNAGNYTYGGSTSITADYTAPVLNSLSLANDAGDNYLNLSERSSTSDLVLPANVTGGLTTTYALISASVTCNNSLTYGAAIPKSNDSGISADGNYKLCVKMTDSALNASFGSSSTFTVKTSVPSFTSLNLSGIVSDGYLSVSENALTSSLVGTLTGSDYDSASYALTGQGVSCDGLLVYGSAPLANDAGITSNGSYYKICVKLADNAGNPAAYGGTSAFQALITAPSCSGVSLTGDVSDGYLNSSERSNVGSIVSTVDGSSSTVTQTNYGVFLTGGSCGSGVTFGSSAPGSNHAGFSPDGTYKVCARVSDDVSQYGYCESSGFVVNTQTMTFTSMDLAGVVSDGYMSISDHTATSGVASNLVGSHYDTAGYALISGSSSCNASVIFGSSIPTADDSGITADGGSYKVCVELSDVAGNPKAYGSTGTFVYDATSPVFTSLGLANTASDSYVNLAEHSQTTDLAGPLVGSGYSQSAYALVASTTTCGLPLTWSSSIPMSDSVGLTSDGTYKICVRLTDVAGNITYDSSSNLEFDGTVPVFTSIALANGASDGYINASESSSATDVVSGLSGTGYSQARYVVSSSASTCSSQAGYSSSTPQGVDFSSLNGNYKVCVKLSDAAGNMVFGSSSTFTVKTSVPSFTSLNLSAIVSDGYLSVSENALTSSLVGTLTGSDYDSASYALTGQGVSCDGLLVYGSAPLANDAGITSNGSYYKICVKLADNAGNPAAYGGTSAFQALITAPSCSGVSLTGDVSDGYLNSSERSNVGSIVSTVDGSSSTVTQTNYGVFLTGGSCGSGVTFGSSAPGSNHAGFSPDGTYKVCARVSDDVSQYGYCESSGFVVNTQTMTFTSMDLAGVVSDGYMSISDHTATSGVASNLVGSHYDTAGYALISGSSSCNASVIFGSSIPTADDSGITADGGSYKVCVELSDVAGNPKAYGSTGTFVYDATSPVFTSLGLANTASDSYVNLAEHSQTTDLAGPLVGSGYSQSAYALVASTTTCGLPLTWSSSIPMSDSVGLTSDGTYKICVRLTDVAGNITYDSSSNLEFDGTVPVFTSIALANGASDGYINASESSSATDVVSGLSGTGYSQARYVVSSSASTCSSQAGYSSSTPQGVDFSSLNGNYKVCVKLSDAAGNMVFGSSSSMAVDRVAPSLTGIVIAGDAIDGYINSSEHSNATSLVGAYTATGYDEVAYALQVSGTDCSTVTSWNSTPPNSNSTDLGSDGAYIVCGKASDLAGNPASYLASSSFSLDTVAPSFSSLARAGDAADGYLNQVERSHASSIVGLLSATGYASASYAVTTSATACNNSVTFGADVLASSGIIVADGNYKLCVKLADAAGNNSFGESSTIVVDSAVPVFTSLARGGDVLDGYLNIAERAAASSLGGLLSSSGASSYGYALLSSGDSCSAGVAFGGMPNSDAGGITDSSTFVICAEISDAAGNKAYGTSLSFTVDLTAPNISAVNLSGSINDGFLNLSDHSAAGVIATSVSASGNDSLVYAILADGVACDGSASFLGVMPKSDSASFTADGSWYLCVKATDLAANPANYRSSSTFIRDIVKPLSSVTTTGTLNPSSTVGVNTVIAGSASDSTTGLSTVSVSIQEGTGNCYDPSTHDFSGACPNWIAATGTSSWTYSLVDSELLKSNIYNVSSRAADVAGNTQTSLGSSSFTWSVSEGDAMWNPDFTYDQSSSDDRALAGAVDSSGNLYIAGYVTNGDKNWMIKKISRRGVEDTTHWNKNIGESGSDQIARGIAVDVSGNVYVVGSHYNGSDWDWMVKKYDADGVEDLSNWDILVDSGGGDDEPMAVATDSSGAVYIIGYGKNMVSASSHDDVWLRKYSSNGVLACEQKLDEGAATLDDRAMAIAINNSTQRFYVTGYRTVAGSDRQLFVKRLRTSDCTVDNSAYGNSTGVSDAGFAVRLDASGNVYVVGSNSSVDQDWWIRKYAANLSFSAEYFADVSGTHQCSAIAIDSSGRIFTGGSKSASSNDLWIRRFSSSLAEVNPSWDKVIDGASGADAVTALVSSVGSGDLNNLYVIGWGSNLVGASSGADWWVKKLSGP